MKEQLWFKVLEKFGLPTLFVLLLFGFLTWKETNDRTDRKAEHTAYVTALEKNTAAIETLSVKVDVLAFQASVRVPPSVGVAPRTAKDQ